MFTIHLQATDLAYDPKYCPPPMSPKIAGGSNLFGWGMFSSIMATGLFFLPFFLQGSGQHAGFVLRGDAWHLLAAQLNYSRFLAHQGVFSGLDFFTHNGASEFFLRPNIPVYHPLVLLLSRVFRVGSGFYTLPIVYLFLLAIPALFSTFFTHRLASRFFGFDAALSTFVALGYAFSLQIVDSVWYLPFSMIAWTFPIVIYAGLAAGAAKCLRDSFLWSLAPFVLFLSGYVPLCIVAIGLAGITTLFFAWDQIKKKGRQQVFIQIAWYWSPLLIACILVFPYYADLFHYNRSVEVTQQPHLLNVVAFITAVPIQNLLHSLFHNVLFSDPKYEFDFFLGVIPLFIIVLFFSQQGDERNERLKSPMMAVCITIFLVFALSVFGSASPVSDVFFFFIPIVGYMHLYQRYLVIAQLFLIIFLALGLDRIAQQPHYGLVRKLAFLTALAVFALAGSVGKSLWGGLGPVTPPLVMECVFALLFLLSFFVFFRKGIILSAAIMMFLISLGSFYAFSHGEENSYQNKKTETITFDPDEMDRLVDYFHRNSNQDLVKYVDLLSNPEPFVPKNLPWFMLDRIKLSSYYGYDWHVGVDYSYRMRAGVTVLPNEHDLVMRPDWSWVKKTQAAFVLYKEGDKGNDPALTSLLDLSDPSRVLRFGPNKEFVFAPIKYKDAQPLTPFNFNNGMISVSGDDSTAHIEKFATNYGNKITAQITSKTPVTIRYLFWPNRHLQARIDGQRIEWEKVDEMLQVTTSPGTHTIEITYVNPLLSLFLVMYGVYAALWAIIF